MKLYILLGLLVGILSQQLAAKVVGDYDDASDDDQPLGFYPQPRIVGGSNAYEGQFPYQISLRVGRSHTCGGSIISANYVVTAAHCVATGNPPKVYPASRFTIRAGSALVNSGGQEISVAQIKVHPSYRGFTNDIALLKLSKPLQFNARVKPIALATQQPPSGAKVLTSGWGGLRTSGPSPQILQYTTLTALSTELCRRVLAPLPDKVICLAHPVGNGVCHGDSGGPAVYDKKLVGVTNYVVGGCGSSKPDGYASVAEHVAWIKQNSDV